MFHPKIKIKMLTLSNFRGEIPRYQTEAASGFDVKAQLESKDAILRLMPGQRVAIPTGLSFELPPGWEIQSRPRSGWALKSGLTVLNTPGTIDADYRGEVKIILANLGQDAVEIKDQDRVAQLILCPVVQAEFEVVQQLGETLRGAGGFGSTGNC